MKIARFFWSWHILKFCLWTATLIILFYAEEDWRGARAWAATKAKWEARGEILDYRAFPPPALPDRDNLAAIPLFKLEPDSSSDSDSSVYPPELKKAMQRVLPADGLTSRMDFHWGALNDRGALRRDVAAHFRATFPAAPIPSSALAQLDALYPFIATLRAASVQRPMCAFPLQHADMPSARNILLVTIQINIVRILTLHGLLALDEHHPDIALGDIRLVTELVLGVQRDPSFIGGLVSIALASISNGILYQGLCLHAWDDAQLAELESLLLRIDYLKAAQFGIRAETAGNVGDIDYIKSGRIDIQNLLSSGENSRPPMYARNFAFKCWPGGWLDQNKTQLADLYLDDVHLVDPRQHRVFPCAADQLDQRTESLASRPMSRAPWNLYFSLVARSIPTALMKFSQAQARVDQSRIACALERYRLKRGQYPAALEALLPECIDRLPHDVIDGRPYHYVLRPDGSAFLLYSIGWNQRDDGGQTVREKDSPVALDPYQGDWVWPRAMHAVPKAAR